MLKHLLTVKIQMFAYMLGKDYVNGIRRIAEIEGLGKRYELFSTS